MFPASLNTCFADNHLAQPLTPLNALLARTLRQELISGVLLGFLLSQYGSVATAYVHGPVTPTIVGTGLVWAVCVHWM